MRERPRQLLFGGAALAVFALALEGASRLLLPMPEVLTFNRVMYARSGLFSASQARRYLSRQSFSWPSAPDGVEPTIHHLNLYGFRCREWRVERSGSRRVLFLGDSFVEGFMAPAEQTIPRAFERAALESGAEIEAMNLGIGGNALLDYVRLAREAVPLFLPDTVVVVIYGNDLPPEPPDPLEMRLKVAQRRAGRWVPRLWQYLDNHRHNLATPLRWERGPFDYLPAVPHQANPWSGAAAELERFVDPAIGAAMRAGRFNPFVMNELSEAERRLVAPAAAAPHLDLLIGICERSGAELLVAYVPYRFQVADHYVPFALLVDEDKQPRSLLGDDFQRHARELAEACRLRAIPFIDLTPDLRARESAGSHCYFDHDMHLRGESYVEVGRRIHELWTASSR